MVGASGAQLTDALFSSGAPQQIRGCYRIPCRFMSTPATVTVAAGVSRRAAVLGTWCPSAPVRAAIWRRERLAPGHLLARIPRHTGRRCQRRASIHWSNRCPLSIPRTDSVALASRRCFAWPSILCLCKQTEWSGRRCAPYGPKHACVVTPHLRPVVSAASAGCKRA